MRALVVVSLLLGTGCNDRCLVDGLNCESLSTEPQPYVTIAAGDTHTCAASTYATTCWGQDQAGSTRPPLGHLSTLAAGHDVTCGILDESVHCWGNPDVVSQTPSTSRFLDILAVGDSHACAASTNTTVAPYTICWGNNSDGQAAQRPAMKALAAGARHTCGLGTSGMIECWGNNDAGQAPATESGAGVVALAAGAQYTCALASNGAARCWGSGPAVTPPSVPFRAISGGTSHACGITSAERSIVCWGDDSAGQASPPPGVYREVAAGDRHTCAIDDSGAAVCWGDDAFGQASPP